MLAPGPTRIGNIRMTFKTFFFAVLCSVLLGALFSSSVLADHSKIRVGRERSIAEASDPAVFAAYQQRMKLRRAGRSSRLRQYYLNQNNGNDAITGSIIRRKGGDGKWYGWRWVGPQTRSDSKYVRGHYERAY